MIVLWVIFWLLMVCVALQEALRNPSIRWWEPVLWEGSSALVATAWMAIAIKARKRHAMYLGRPLAWFGRHLAWLPLVILSFIAAIYAMRYGIYAALDRTYQHDSWRFVLAYETVKITLFAGLWLGLLFGMDSHEQWRTQRLHLLQTRKALAEAQLSQLRGQLRPHFLFNALNTVSALMHADVARADHLVATLGDLLRSSLRPPASETIPLEEELRTLKLYAEVMRERFRDRVTIDWQIDESLHDMPVPALLLQPLLENAFRHGVERTAAAVHIQVHARCRDEALEIVVHNSGSTLDPACRDGTGCHNCRKRLDILYGGKASLQLHDEGDGVAARVTLPLGARQS